MNFKKILTLVLIPIFFLTACSLVSAKKVALAVMNSANLDPIHEQKLYDILVSMNNSVTLIDQYSSVNYTDFDLLVVAGRPPSDAPLSATFMENLPVNSMPTIAMDYYNIYEWGWVGSGGVNMMFGGSYQVLYIESNNNPITAGYLPSQRIFVHNITGLLGVDLIGGTSNFTFVANLDTQGDGGIAFGAPNTKLSHGKQIANNSVSIFFGTLYPAYWTNDMEHMFRNAVGWVTNINFSPPTAPTLSGPSSFISNSGQYTWSAATGVNGVQNYEIQVSLTSDFTAIVQDKKISSLSYTFTNFMDGQTYYGRVRSIDYLNLQSSWSNTITTIADFSEMLFTINSPLNGTELHLNDTIFVDVDVNAPRLPDGSNCVISIGEDFITNIIYNQSSRKCSANITIPETLGGGGLLNSAFTVSATNSLGSTNSSSITVFFNRSFSVSISPDKSSYNTGETATISGSVTMNDNGAKVTNASINYSVGIFSGSMQTDSNGFYSFNIINLADGDYTPSVQATHHSASASNSTYFSVSPPSSSSGSGSSGGSGSYGPGSGILSITAPDNLTFYENTTQEISVRVKNEGPGIIHIVKVTVTGLEADVQPHLVDLNVGQYQDFTVALHIPSGPGNKQITLKALGFEAMRTKKLSLTILPAIFAPELRITNIDLPTFNEGEQTTINITVENIGNLTGTATASISLPSGWLTNESEKTFDLPAGSKQLLSFSVTPSNESGQLISNVNYLVNNQQQQVSQSASVTANPKKETVQEVSMTGMIAAAVSNPVFYIPVFLTAILILVYAFKKNSIKNLLVRMPIKNLLQKTPVKSSNTNSFSNNFSRPRKINPASSYLKWERRQRPR